MKIMNEDYKSIGSVALMEKINKLRKPASLCISAGAACAVGGPSMFELFGLGKYQFIPIIAAVIVFALACHKYYQIFLIKKELAARPVTQEEKDTAKERNKKSNIKYILILLALLLLCIFFPSADRRKVLESLAEIGELFLSQIHTTQTGGYGNSLLRIAELQ